VTHGAAFNAQHLTPHFCTVPLFPCTALVGRERQTDIRTLYIRFISWLATRGESIIPRTPNAPIAPAWRDKTDYLRVGYLLKRCCVPSFNYTPASLTRLKAATSVAAGWRRATARAIPAAWFEHYASGRGNAAMRARRGDQRLHGAAAPPDASGAYCYRCCLAGRRSPSTTTRTGEAFLIISYATSRAMEWTRKQRGCFLSPPSSSWLASGSLHLHRCAPLPLYGTALPPATALPRLHTPLNTRTPLAPPQAKRRLHPPSLSPRALRSLPLRR